MKKELEFEINNGILSVLEFDWFIDRIDAVYVRNSEIGKKCEYAIYIQQGSEIIELYFRSTDEMIVAKEFNKLCAALKEFNPLFDNAIHYPILVNFANLKNVEYKNIS